MQRMAQIVEAVPDLGPGSRILDVGSGTRCLIPFFRQRGVQDVLAVDLAPDMLAKACAPMRCPSWRLMRDSAPVNECLQKASMLSMMLCIGCHSHRRG